MCWQASSTCLKEAEDAMADETGTGIPLKAAWVEYERGIRCVFHNPQPKGIFTRNSWAISLTHFADADLFLMCLFVLSCGIGTYYADLTHVFLYQLFLKYSNKTMFFHHVTC